MFGYVRYDLPNLYIKDFMLYKAMYCGLCKGIACSCGHKARIGLSYDVAFLSAILHNIAGVDIHVEKQHCFEHCFAKQPMAVVDDLTKELGALNVVLTYYKLTDDIADGDKGRGKRLWFKKGFKRAKKTYPELVRIVDGHLKKQTETEKQKVSSPEIAADCTANMLKALSDYFLKEKATEHTAGLFYALGKWIYLVDALDDYDKDIKKKAYNPFILSYASENKQALLKEHGKEISFLFDTTFYAMRESLSGISFSFNRDLTDNIVLRGIPLETMRVFKGEKRNKMKKRIK